MSAPERARPAPGGPAPRRFYAQASLDERDGVFHLVLDGRPARTPARHPLALPSRALGEAVAAEWNGQAEVLDLARMPLTKLANTAIDGVAPQADAVRDDIARYAGSDLVCYRATEPDTLVAAQAGHWDPVLATARDMLGARFVLAGGLVYVAQPGPALDAVRRHLAEERSPSRLAALHVITTLTGSALIALVLANGRMEPDAAWNASLVDEHIQESRWGQDSEALARRALRRAEFDTAVAMLTLA